MRILIMDSVGIVGFGRFGKILAQILTDDFKVKAYDLKKSEDQHGVEHVDYSTLFREKTIFIAVPIRAFKQVIMDMEPHLAEGTTIIDVCSVKVYPVNVMQEILPETVKIIATHPLFGPDSIGVPKGLKIMMHQTRCPREEFQTWKTFFESKALEVQEMIPEDHDRLGAKTQGITHFMGRVLREAGVESTDIDTLGFKDLLGVIDQTCNDSWELFSDLQNFNPYTHAMIQKLEAAISNIRGKITRRD